MSEKFEFKYSKPTPEERNQIYSIKNQYLPKNEQEGNLDELKRLDNLVKSIPTTVGLIVGIIGVLLFGTRMAFFLEITNVWYLGIPFSIIGVIVMAITPIIHNKLLNKYKKKYGPRIIELSNKLLEE